MLADISIIQHERMAQPLIMSEYLLDLSAKPKQSYFSKVTNIALIYIHYQEHKTGSMKGVLSTHSLS